MGKSKLLLEIDFVFGRGNIASVKVMGEYTDKVDHSLAERLNLPDANFYHVERQLFSGFAGIHGITGQNYSEFNVELTKHLALGGTLVLDLANIIYMTPYVMRDLLALQKNLKEEGRRFILLNVQEDLNKALISSGLTEEISPRYSSKEHTKR